MQNECQLRNAGFYRPGKLSNAPKELRTSKGRRRAKQRALRRANARTNRKILAASYSP